MELLRGSRNEHFIQRHCIRLGGDHHHPHLALGYDRRRAPGGMAIVQLWNGEPEISSVRDRYFD
jgi:hypothetical protein